MTPNHKLVIYVNKYQSHGSEIYLYNQQLTTNTFHQKSYWRCSLAELEAILGHSFARCTWLLIHLGRLTCCFQSQSKDNQVFITKTNKDIPKSWKYNGTYSSADLQWKNSSQFSCACVFVCKCWFVLAWRLILSQKPCHEKVLRLMQLQILRVREKEIDRHAWAHKTTYIS